MTVPLSEKICLTHSAALPIKQVIKTPGSDRSKINTVLVLNTRGAS